MDLQIIDRRLAGKNKSIGNKERFLRRYRGNIKDAIERDLSAKKIGDIGNVDVVINPKDLSQPIFNHASSGGIRETVHPGNKEYLKGDRIARPQGGGGNGVGSGNGGDGEEMDNYTFQISRKEAFEMLYADCGLPNMMKEYLLGNSKFKFQRSGIVKSGSPNNLHAVRTVRAGITRRMIFNAPAKRELVQLKKDFEDAESDEHKTLIQDQINALLERPRPRFLDPIDERYRGSIKVPKPVTKAVFFRVMDVSGSMEQQQKNDAKLFFTMVGMMLDKEYDLDDIKIVNVRYHSKAKECDENDFFYNPETGGTEVAPALQLIEKIIEDRYPPHEWNIYIGLISDGDTGNPNDEKLTSQIIPRLVALCQHFFYIELKDRENALGEIIKESLDEFKNFSMKTKVNRGNLGEVFKGFFEKRGIYQESRPTMHFEDLAYES